MRKQKINYRGKIVGIIFCLIAIVCSICGIIYDNGRRIEDEQNKEFYSKIKEGTKASEGDADEIVIDWDSLEEYDVVGWLKFDENIDYPIVQGKDNNEYLRTAVDRTYNTAGSIFLSANNLPDFTDSNSIVYGHNMRNGSMFGTLKTYLDPNFNGISSFSIYLPDGTKHTYMIYSVNQTQDGSICYQYTFKDGEFETYQDNLKQTSVKDFGIDKNVNRRFVTLATCSSIGSSLGKRVVVTGMEYSIVKTQKPASWYNRLESKEKEILERRNK